MLIMTVVASEFRLRFRLRVGIDIGKDYLDVCLAYGYLGQEARFSGFGRFTNEAVGFEALLNWVAEKAPKDEEVAPEFVMEATGVYYQALAHWLNTQGYKVSVLLPNLPKAFARSFNIKTKNDQVDARVLAHMGYMRRLHAWKPQEAEVEKLKQLTRHRERMVKQRGEMCAQLHSLKKSYPPCPETIGSQELLIESYTQQIKLFDQKIRTHIKAHPELKRSHELICSIPSIATTTAAVLIAETGNFQFFLNQAQLVSYAGYDVSQKQSGSSLKAPERISKKGNYRIRKALFFPSLRAPSLIPDFKRLYDRVNAKNLKTKMKGAVALQRKLLVIAYQLVKTDQPFDPTKHQ